MWQLFGLGTAVADRLFMAGLFDGNAIQLVSSIALLAVLAVAGIWTIGKIRAKTLQQEPTASHLLAKFRELHSQGVLSDAEFRTIKTALTVQLQQELKGNDETL